MSVRAEAQIDLARVDDGAPGSQGTTFIPSVDVAGDISWTNDGGLPNPPTQNIMGPPGTSGPSITDVKTQYYLSTSNVSPTGGSWSDTPQAFVSGQYYWTRDYVTYSDSTHTTSTPVYNQGLTLANEYAMSASDAATDAQTSAYNANTSATNALKGLGLVQDVVDVLTWISKHGQFVLTTDTETNANVQYWELTGGEYVMVDVPLYDYVPTSDVAIDPSKTYYTREGSGTAQDPYDYVKVDNPVVADIGTYYEQVPTDPNALGYYVLDTTGSVENYIASHLALLNDGLYIMADDSDYKMKLDSTAMYIINPQGDYVGQYGSTMTIGAVSDIHLEGTATKLGFFSPDGEIAYFGQTSDGIWSLFIDNAEIDDMIRFGDYAFIHRANGNMTIKWLGA